MHKFIAVAGLAAFCVAGASDAADAKGKYSCKPAITGWGSDGFAHKAKSKAIASYKAKAAAAYGKIVWNNTIGQHCTKLQKGLGWQCWFRAQPCVDGGLKPSIQKTPFVKPQRLSGRPGARGGPKALRIAPKPRPKRGLRLR